MTVAGLTLYHCIWSRLLAIQTYECLAVSVESLDWGIHGIESVVVAALAIFCLMIDS